MPQSNKVSTLEAGALRRFVPLVRIGIQYVTFAARQTHRLTRLLYLAAEVIPSLKCPVEQNINFGNCCIDAQNAHTFIIEFAVSKLDVFFSRAISAAENKRSIF